MKDHSPTSFSRRDLARWAGALTLAATTTALAGCEPASSADPLAASIPNADAELTAQALSAERLMVSLLAAAAEGHALGPALAATMAVHQSHVDLLAPAVPDASSPTPPADPALPQTSGKNDAKDALARLAAAEQQLTATQGDHALRARSGQLARILASMSAAAAQQAVVLPGLVR